MPFKIRTKLIVAFLAMLIPLVVIVCINRYNDKAIYLAAHKVEELHREIARLSDLQIALDMLIMPPNDFLITGNSREREEFHRLTTWIEEGLRDLSEDRRCRKCHEVTDDMVKRLYGLEPKTFWSDEMVTMRGIWDGLQVIKEKGEEIFKLERPTGSKEGAALMQEMDAMAHRLVREDILKHREKEEKELSSAIKDSEKIWKRSWVMMTGGFVVSLAVGLSFAFFYSGFFVKPIKVLHERADAVAAGDFTSKVHLKTGDELEQLANAMNEMAEKLDDFYGTLEDQVRERTRGLQESEERFRQLFQGGNDAIFVHHIMPDGGPGKFIEVNNLACERLGFTREEFLKMSPLDIDAPDMSGSREAILKDFAEKKHAIFEMAHMTKDGRRIPVEVNAHIFELNGEPMVLSIVRDITERKKAEQAIKEERDYSKSIIETAQAIILTLDTEGRIVSFNRYMEKLSGYKLDDVKGKDWFTTFIPEYEQGRIRNIFKEAISDIQIKGNVNPILTRDGREVVVEWYAETLKDSNGKILGLLAIGQDITERKVAEEKINRNLDDLKRMNKMMVDREIRMIELKKENQRLRDELGSKSS